MTRPIDINKHIRELAVELPYFEFIRMDHSWMLGAYLKLTGVKDFKGEPIEDLELYQIEVPVLKKLTTEHHEQSMRTAYLIKGLPGLYEYLSRYLTTAQLQMIKNYFMRAS